MIQCAIFIKCNISRFHCEQWIDFLDHNIRYNEIYVDTDGYYQCTQQHIVHL